MGTVQKINNTDYEEEFDKDMLEKIRMLEAVMDIRENVIKHNRNILRESKNVIKLVHQYRGNKETERKLVEAKKQINKIAKTCIGPLLKILFDSGVWPYRPVYVSGIEEFTEAVVFYHYIAEKRLFTYDEVLNMLQLVSPDTFDIRDKDVVTKLDYIYGILDVSGELMRFCITTIHEKSVEDTLEIINFIQVLYQNFSCMLIESDTFTNKVAVLKQSLHKVKWTVFQKRMNPDLNSSVDSFSVMDDVMHNEYE